MPAIWAPVVFWILLVPLIIIMLIVYLRSKKFYRLVYILSVFTYAMTIMYWIDAYQLGRNAIVGLLVVSALIMIGIGFVMRKQSKISTKATKKKSAKRSISIAIACMIVIAVIVGLSASQIGWKITTQATKTVMLKDVVRVIQEGQPDYGPGPGVPLYTITVTNSFMPRQYELPQASACLYNTEKKAATELPVDWDMKEKPSDFGQGMKTVELGGKTSKTITLKAMPMARVKPQPIAQPPVPESQEKEVYDQVLIFLNEGRIYIYTDCYNLQPEDFEKAIRISVLQN